MSAKRTLLLVMITLLGISCLCANLPPEVSNVTVAQRTDGSKIVDIWYDVIDADNDSLLISMEVSDDGGTTFAIVPTPANLSGDVGEWTMPGAGKHIVWNAGAEAQIFDAASYVFKVTADNPETFILVEGGTFNNGTSSVTLSSFYIDKYELIQAEYQAVMGINPSYFSGVSNGPVETVSWVNAIEYCNRRSMQEGYTPCYSYSFYGTNPDNWPWDWNLDYTLHTNVSCNWSANGYRLPTEMEWMYAAIGGNQSQNYTYSGSNTIGDVAWYYYNSGDSTHVVGSKAANELGIYDMSGNVWEWVWDIYDSYPSGAQTNPHGPVSGNSRVLRGGSFGLDAEFCTGFYRWSYDATGIDLAVGLRLCRSTDNFVLVEGGTFNNGISYVTLSSFYIDKYEVTQASYQAVMGTNPSHFSGNPNRPVEQVSWFNAIEYCNRRSMQVRLAPCYSYSSYGTNPDNWPLEWNAVAANHLNVTCNWTASGYRLPTEMEWMFSAMGGNLSHGYTYSGSNNADSVAWTWHNSDLGGSRSTQDVGTKAPNELNAFDMSGNVWEWCWDIHIPGAYPSWNQINPTGPTYGADPVRVVRGGHFAGDYSECEVTYRVQFFANGIAPYNGFRVARNTQ